MSATKKITKDMIVDAALEILGQKDSMLLHLAVLLLNLDVQHSRFILNTRIWTSLKTTL